MLKKWLVRLSAGIFGLVALLFAAAYVFVGYSPIYIYNAPAVATGIGAKLACSARYVSEMPLEQLRADIEVYSPILGLLEYEFDDATKTASASLPGIKTRTASYQNNMGCYLDYRGFNQRAQIDWPDMKSANAAWPKGNVVLTIDSNVQENLDAMLAADNADGHDTRALLVAHKGKIVAESYADGFSEESRFLGWSMAKSVTAQLLGQLEMAGRVNVSETDIFPEWTDGRASISIENMLNMTDGLAYDEHYDPGDTAVRMLFQEPDAAEYMRSLPLRDAPGTTFNYSSGITNVLAEIVHQRIEGDYAQDALTIANDFFRPMGMTSAVFETDASGAFVGSSYLYASARDWARVGQLMLNGGELNGVRFMTEDYVSRALQYSNAENERAYGYQWWLNIGDAQRRWKDLPRSSYAAMGNREQRVMVIPDDELVIVRLGWSPKDYIDNDNFAEIRSWFQ